MRKLERTDIGFICWTVLIWTGINLFLNVVGLWGKGLLSDEIGFRFDIDWHGKYLAYQTLNFTGVFTLIYWVARRRKFAIYSFVVVQMVAFHIIFLKNLVKEEGVTRFATSCPSFELTYLESHGQELVDIISIYYPMMGLFDCGIFSPEDTLLFYLTWIFLPLLYFFSVGVVTDNFVKRFVL